MQVVAVLSLLLFAAVVKVAPQKCLPATQKQVDLYYGKCKMSSKSTFKNNEKTTCYIFDCEKDCVVNIQDDDGKMNSVRVKPGETKEKGAISKKIGNTTTYKYGYKIVCKKADLHGVTPLEGVLPPPTYTYENVPPKLRKRNFAKRGHRHAQH